MQQAAARDAGLSLAYFIDLQPDTLTSCCGSSFAAERPGLAAHAAAVAPATGLWGLFGTLAVVVAWGLGAGRSTRLAQGFGLASLVFAAVALVAVVAAVSPYVYESPHHHCPFCLLKREYGYIGFLLYAPLFGGAACGLAAGALSWRVPASLQVWLPSFTQRLRAGSMLGFVVFSALAGLLVWRSALRL